MSTSLYRPKHLAFFLAFVAGFVWLATEQIVSNAVMLDEFALVPAGISHWQTGRFGLYRASPPLIPMLEALPVWLSGATMDYSRAGLSHRSEWNVGLDFMKANGPRFGVLLERARFVSAALAVACGVLIFWWTSTRDGGAAAVIASALWFSDPNVLAHGTIATTDIGATFFALLATFLFGRFLESPRQGRTIAAGVGLGLALATKFSLAVLCPAWLLLAVVARRQNSTPCSWKRNRSASRESNAGGWSKEAVGIPRSKPWRSNSPWARSRFLSPRAGFG